MKISDSKDWYCDFVLNNKVKVKKVKETENILAFHHTKPSYEFHIVIIPKKHVAKLTDLKNFGLIDEIFEVAKEIILKQGLNESNYRIITNGGSFQDSKHLHFHLVSGEKVA